MKALRLIGRIVAVWALAAVLAHSAAAQNFTLTLQPNSVTLIPAKSASFVVSLTPLNGFTSQVSLVVGALPSGVTASFSPNPLTLPGTSLLTLDAATNAALGSFTLNVTGSGGGVTNTTSSSVTVNFGLLPLCTGGFQGTITDVETGLPVGGAFVQAGFYSVRADATGHYIFTNVQLSTDNQPLQYGIQSSRTDYWHSAFSYSYAVCDVTNTVNLQMLRQQYGSISGTVTDPGGKPLRGVSVSLNGPSNAQVGTDTNGTFQSGSLSLGYSNAPASYSVYGSTNGYWQASTNTVIAAGSNSVVHLILVPVCTATVTGRVMYADTALPATNITVQASDGYGGGSTNTDVNGNYVIPGLLLGFDNVPVVATIQASAAGYNYSSTNAPISNCLQVVAVPTLLLQPLARNNYGNAAGHVYDMETGLPLTNASVSLSGVYSAYVDTNGAYLITNALLGTGSTTSRLYSVIAYSSVYYQNSSNVTLFAGQTVTQDVSVLRMRFGEVSGVVRDSATHLPVAKANINGFFLTGADGHYDTGLLQLNNPNQPTLVSLSASASGYWPIFTNTTIHADTTNLLDIELIRVCSGATIVGNVVNAITQAPITNATIYVNFPAYQAAQSDSGGNFILTNITVGNNNSPIQTTVNATAPGFNPQSHTVTIFCGATITTEFGVPQTSFGSIEGYVTNVLTGLPLTNVFIGSEFGAATSTDTNGYYILNQAPLGANGASRTWTVTAIPIGFPAQTKSTTVTSNTVSRLDFGFGQAPALLAVTVTGAPNPVQVGSNLLYTVTLRNTAANAANVQLMDALPPNVTFVSAAVTNLAGSSFGAPIFSNSIVTTTSASFASNATVLLLVAVTPTTAGLLTNVATVSSDTPDIDVTGSNHTSVVTTTVNAPAVLLADVGITMTGLPNPVLVSNQLTYTLTIHNSGPADAPDVVVTDSLPASVSFVSAVPSQGSATHGAATLRWDAGPLPKASNAQLTLVVLPSAVGVISNAAVVVVKGGVIDNNPDNDNASVLTTVNAPAVTNVSVQVLGPIVFNRQTGLFEQPIGFNNLSGNPIQAVRIAVLGLPADVALYNASGASNGVAFVEYDNQIGPGARVGFTLEYYRSSRLDFVSTNFSATAVSAAPPVNPTGTTLQLDRAPFLYNGSLVIEFASVPGSSYVVQYSADMQTWKTAVPPLIAAGTRIQWIDAGPPKTDSAPGAPGQRFYRIVQLP